jgi:prepilin-type N-terminal cleavage/methylation domain-containing protein
VPDYRQHPRRRSGHGFTMVELLVVIAIISLLTGLLVLAISKMSTSGKRHATETDLQNIKGMFDELNAATNLTTAPDQWLWRRLSNNPAVVDSTVFIPNYSNYQLDFWRTPMRTGPSTAVPGVPNYLDCLDAPKGSLANDPMVRNASRAVLNTQLAMRIILATQSNRTAIAQLPADRKMVPEFESGNLSSGMGGSNGLITGMDGLSGTGDDGGDTVQTVVYCVNNCVRYQGATFRCVKANAGASPPVPTTPPNAPASNTNWVQDDNPTPLILDAWGNPIIFVPATGLINVFTGAGTPDATVAALPPPIGSIPAGISRRLPAITSPEGQNDPNYGPPAVAVPPGQKPPGRPFFVSAGPDGDLSTGDDNLYSFEK